MIKILVVEDEKPISDLICLSLSDIGYECVCAYDGMTAANIIEKEVFDLILLDIMLPKVNGYELLEYIRPLEIPVIFLTAKSSLDDKVKGLTIGAEDYITKPFEIAELQARVNVVLRRYNKLSSSLNFKDITIDIDSRVAARNGKKLELTSKEFELLVLLVRNVNITLFREKMYETVWEKDYYGETRTLDLHIQRLKKKAGLENDIKTVYKVGYRLEDN